MVLVVPHDRDEVLGGVQIRAVPRPGGRVRRMTVTAAQVYRRAVREEADLYHVHDPELLPVAGLLRLAGRRVVYDMHENVPKALLSRHWIPRRFRGLVAGLYRGVERLLLANLPVVFAEQSYRNHYPFVRAHATVQNMPLLDLKPDDTVAKSPVPTVGYVGVVAPARGISVVLDALDALNAASLEVHGEFIGPVYDPAYEAEVERRTGRYSTPRVRFRGRMGQAEAFRVLSTCHVGLAVLQPAPNYVDSYPTKMFEYMALGIPVVVSDFPLYRSVVEREECGLCVDPEDSTAVAQAIRWLVEHPGEADEMGARGQRAVLERYNWGTEADALLALYRRVLS